MPNQDIRTRTAKLYDDLWGRHDRKAFDVALREGEDYYPLPEAAVRGKRCLDVGCGVGFFVTRLFRAGAAEVHAVDIGAQNRKNTVRWNGEWHDRLHVHDMDALDLKFPDATFDYVHSNGVLHHTEHPEKGFSELVRVTKSGGMTVIGMYGKGGLVPAWISVMRWLCRHVPFAWVSAGVSFLFRNPYDQYLLLDHFYVPIQRRYREADLRGWFADAGYHDIVRTRPPHRHDTDRLVVRLMHGEGYITLQGRKP